MSKPTYNFTPGDKLFAKDVNTVNPEEITPIKPANLVGGINNSVSNLQSTGVGSIKFTIDGDVYDNVNVDYSDLNVLQDFDLSRTKREWIEHTLDFGTGIYGMTFKNNGQKFYTVSLSDHNIREYTLTTPYDLSTATLSNSFLFSGDGTSGRAFYISPNGTKMYIATASNNRLHEYTLSTAYDVSTATKVRHISLSNVYGVVFSDDGTKLYVSISTSNILERDLSTAWNISTVSGSLSVNLGAIHYGLQIYGDYLLGSVFENKIRKYPFNGSIVDLSDDYSLGNFEELNVNYDSGGSIPFVMCPDGRLIDATYNFSIAQPYREWRVFYPISNILQNAIRSSTNKKELVDYKDEKVVVSSSLNKLGSVLKFETPSSGVDITGETFLDLGANATEVPEEGDGLKLGRVNNIGKFPFENMPFEIVPTGSSPDIRFVDSEQKAIETQSLTPVVLRQFKMPNIKGSAQLLISFSGIGATHSAYLMIYKNDEKLLLNPRSVINVTSNVSFNIDFKEGDVFKAELWVSDASITARLSTFRLWSKIEYKLLATELT